MARKQRISVTRPERLHWLQQLDSGVGITEITRASGRDIRLVKRHIEIAREEVQTANVRKEYLLVRLQQHQDDLLNQVGRIRVAVMIYPPPALEPGDALKQKIHNGLLDHLKAFSQGKLVVAFEKAARENISETERIRDQISDKEKDLLTRIPVSLRTYPWTPSIMADLEAGLLEDKPSDSDYMKSKVASGKYEVRHKALNLTRSPLQEPQVEAVIQAHKELLTFSSGFKPVCFELRSRLENIGSKLADELDTLIIKRLVPGRCRYCPI